MRVWPLMLAIVPLVLASLASGQSEPTTEPTPTSPSPTPAREAPFKMGIEPAFLQAPSGGEANATLVLFNPHDREIVLRLTATPQDGALTVALARSDVRVPPNATERVALRIAVAKGAALGDHTYEVHAVEPDATTATADRVGVTTIGHVDVKAAPSNTAPFALSIAPSPIPVAPGNTTTATVTLKNNLRRDVTITLRTPTAPEGAGLALTLAKTSVTLAPGGSTTIVLAIDAAKDAPNGTVKLALAGKETLEPTIVEHTFAVLVGPRPAAAIKPIIPTPTPTPSSEASPATAPTPPDDDEALPAVAWGAAAGAASVGAGGAAVLSFRRRGWAFTLLAPLYTRIAKNKVLEQPVRERIAQLVQAEPGITFGDLQRRLDVGAGTLTHHARMLEDAGVLFSSPDGQQRRFFHVGQGRVAPVPPLAERALTHLQANGPLTLTDLARALNVSKQTLHYHVKKLTTDGRVSVDEDGRIVPLVGLAP